MEGRFIMSRHANRFDSTYRPLARTKELVTTESSNEVLIYDERVHHMHHLDAEVTAVWHHCDGRRTPEAISLATGIDRIRVLVSLRKLDERQLLDNAVPAELREQKESRRKFLRKAGVATLPAIVSVTAPIAKAAASGGRPECQLPEGYPAGYCWDDCGCPNGTSCLGGRYIWGDVGQCY
jgi:hypothetical protein